MQLHLFLVLLTKVPDFIQSLGTGSTCTLYSEYQQHVFPVRTACTKFGIRFMEFSVLVSRLTVQDSVQDSV